MLLDTPLFDSVDDQIAYNTRPERFEVVYTDRVLPETVHNAFAASRSRVLQPVQGVWFDLNGGRPRCCGFAAVYLMLSGVTADNMSQGFDVVDMDFIGRYGIDYIAGFMSGWDGYVFPNPFPMPNDGFPLPESFDHPDRVLQGWQDGTDAWRLISNGGT